MFSNAEKNLVSWAEERFDFCHEMRRHREKDWYAGIAFLVGKQHVAWNPVQHRLETVRIKSQYLNFVSNQMRPIYTTSLAQMSQVEPMFGAGYGGTSDQVSATVALKVLHHYNRVLKIKQKLKIAYRWVVGTGNAFLYTYWNSLDGVPIADGLNTGDVSCEVLNPFEVWFDVTGNKDHLDQADWVFIGRLVNQRDLVSLFGSDVKKCKAETSLFPSGIESHVQQRLAHLHQTRAIEGVEPKCFLKIMFVHPVMGKEHGKVIVYCDDKVLMKTGFLFHGLGYPVRHLGFHPVPGCIYYDGQLKDCIQPQKAYNRKRGRIIQAVDAAVKPKILAPTTARLQPNSFHGGINEKIYYSPFGQAKPEYMQTFNPPTAAFADLDRDRMDLEQLSGQHETAHARVPKSVRSGIALSLLQGRDDTRLGFVIGNIEDESEIVGKQIIFLVQQHVKEERIGAIVEGGKYETFKFKGADIKDGTDIYVIKGSAFPANLNAKRDYILTLWDRKILTDPDETKRLLELSGVLGVHPPKDEKDQKIVQLENDLILDGELPQAHWFDRHETHLLGHSEFCKEVQLEYSPEEAEQIIQMELQHMMQHVNMIRPPESAAGTSPAIEGEAGAIASPIGQPPGGPAQPPGAGGIVPQGGIT